MLLAVRNGQANDRYLFGLWREPQFTANKMPATFFRSNAQRLYVLRYKLYAIPHTFYVKSETLYSICNMLGVTRYTLHVIRYILYVIR